MTYTAPQKKIIAFSSEFYVQSFHVNDATQIQPTEPIFQILFTITAFKCQIAAVSQTIGNNILPPWYMFTFLLQSL